MIENREKLVREAFRRADERIRAQTEIALAADARALNFCGLALAAASLLVGLASHSGLAIGMYVAAFGLYIAAGVAGYAARPVNWRAPGQKGSDLAEDIASDRPIAEVLAEITGHLDNHIVENNGILAWNAKCIWTAAVVAVAGIGAGALVLVAMWLTA